MEKIRQTLNLVKSTFRDLCASFEISGPMAITGDDFIATFDPCLRPVRRVQKIAGDQKKSPIWEKDPLMQSSTRWFLRTPIDPQVENEIEMKQAKVFFVAPYAPL